MTGLHASLRIVVPILLMMLLGLLLRRMNILTDNFQKGLNNLCFRVFFPVLTFYNISTADVSEVWNGRLMGFAVISLLAIFLVLCLLIPLIERDLPRQSVLILSIFRSNFVIFGTIIAAALSGEENLGAISLLVATVVPITNTICVLVFEVSRHGSIRSGNIKPGRLLVDFVKNPLLLAAIIGFLVSLLPFSMPDLLMGTIRDVSRCATPVSLMVCGSMFRLGAARRNQKDLIIGILGRLLLIPGVMLPITVAMGFRETELVALMSMYMGPTAISIFNMAGAMEADADLAGQLVVLSSVGSVATIFGWVWLMGCLALI